MIGTRAVVGEALSRCAASHPSITGRLMSRRIRSGVSLSAMRIACMPSAAIRTSWPLRCSRRDSMSRFMSLSSTSRILAMALAPPPGGARSQTRLSHSRAPLKPTPGAVVGYATGGERALGPRSRIDTRPFPHPRAARAGRHGLGLPGPRGVPRPARGAQGPAPRVPPRPRLRRALQARGQGHRPARAPQHRPHLRLRHRPRARHPLDGPAARGERGPGETAGRGALAAPQARASPRPSGRSRSSGALPTLSTTRTGRASSTATSSPRTCCSTRTAASTSPTSASRRCSSPRGASPPPA